MLLTPSPTIAPEFNNNNNNKNMPLLCYEVKHLVYIPQISVVWRRTTSQAGYSPRLLSVPVYCGLQARRRMAVSCAVTSIVKW
jgi:hypothetical protein